MSSLVDIVGDVATRIGIHVPAAVVGSSDPNTRLLLALTQQEGRDLASRHPWQVLTKEKTFTATATEEQANVIPADFDRFVDSTFWNRTENRLVLGPVSAVDWQALKSDRIQAVHDTFRQRGNSLYMLPTPTAGATYAFEYVSTYWVGLTGSTTATLDEFAGDTDIPYLDAELIRLGVVWRYLRARGLDYAEAFQSYELAVKRKIGRDGGSPTLNMSGPSDRYPIPRATIPDGSWNLS